MALFTPSPLRFHQSHQFADHVTDGTATGLAPIVGSEKSYARGDHSHGTPTDVDLAGPSFATPAIVLGTAAAAGVAATIIRSDATIAAFDATVPTTSAVGAAAGAGAAAVAARRDHTHGREAFAAPVAVGTANAAGAATTVSRSDHVHADSSIIAFSAQSTALPTLNTPVANGTKRRLVIAQVSCVANVTDKAFAGYVTTVAGQAVTVADAVGYPAGIVESGRFTLFFEVDPGANYQITSDVSGAGTATIASCLAVDL